MGIQNDPSFTAACADGITGSANGGISARRSCSLWGVNL